MKYQDFAPAKTTRIREEIEWSSCYTYNAPDTTLPRVLLIGDSICMAYHSYVRELLEGKVNVTYWSSSKCVTDPDYFRELDFVLDGYRYDMISFNNGLHSLSTNREEWTTAYTAAVDFIRAKLPATKLTLTLCTPLKDANLTQISSELNAHASSVAEKYNIPTLDLFTPMDALDREKYWGDVFHFAPEAVEMQAKIISDHVLDRLGL